MCYQTGAGWLCFLWAWDDWGYSQLIEARNTTALPALPPESSPTWPRWRYSLHFYTIDPALQFLKNFWFVLDLEVLLCFCADIKIILQPEASQASMTQQFQVRL